MPRTISLIAASAAALAVAVPTAAAAGQPKGAHGADAAYAITGSAAIAEPAWARALRLRSEALNKQYALGAWELRTTASPGGDEPAWMRALRLRSEALNRQHKLGDHAPTS